MEIVSVDEIKDHLENEETFKDVDEDKSPLIEKIASHLYPYDYYNLITCRCCTN